MSPDLCGANSFDIFFCTPSATTSRQAVLMICNKFCIDGWDGHEEGDASGECWSDRTQQHRPHLKEMKNDTV